MAIQTRYHLGGFVAAAPQQNRAELYDGTAGTYTSWDTSGVQTSTRALTTAEAATLAAVDTANAAGTNQATLTQQAQTAMTNNRTYVALAAPTTAQVTAQVKALTQQNNAIIRLLLNQFDATN